MRCFATAWQPRGAARNFGYEDHATRASTYLFAAQAEIFDAQAMQFEPPPADFIERIRDELIGMLALVTEAGEVPWADPTKALLDQMRFRSIAGWLPAAEAAGLRAAFQGELLRLYGPEPEDEGLLAE